MTELSRDGHRNRVRETYMKTGLSGMADHNILEMILFYAIPRKDTKELSYNILNHFGGDLTRVFSADVSELKKIKGVGDSAAVLISLFYEVHKTLNLKKNEEIQCLLKYEDSKKYCRNILSPLKNERAILITLDNDFKIIDTHVIAEGTVNSTNIEPRRIVEAALKDNASSVIISHNHPNGSYLPSSDDEKFTVSLNELLKQLSITLYDHIVVGVDGAISMRFDIRYAELFKKK